MRELSKYIISLTALIALTSFSQQKDSLKINYNYINSVPQNADVFLNNMRIGSTPLYFTLDSNLTEVKITLRLKGYAEYSFQPSSRTEIINKTYVLVPLRSNLRSEIVHENKSYAFPKKLKVVPMVLSSLLTAVSAVMAYYYKSLAIDKQDEFYVIGDPSLLDDKKKYDVISGVSLAIFQIGFAALLYFHFIE